MNRLLEQFRALPPWQRYFLLLAAPIIISVYAYMMLVSPTLDEISKLETEKQNTQAEIERLKTGQERAIVERLRKEEEALTQEYLKKQAELTEIVGEIPTEKDVGKVVANIGKIARKSGLVIVNLQFSNPQKVTYVLSQEGEKKIIREEQDSQTTGQQEQRPQNTKQTQEGVSFLRSEVKLTLMGTYDAVKAFLEGMRKEGVISYPVSISLFPEGSKIRAEVLIYILMKEGQKP